MENARTLLRQALFRLSEIGARYGAPLVATREYVARNLDFPISSDYADFMGFSMEAVAQNTSRLDLYRGPFLDGETDDNRSAWDGWVQDRRQAVDNQLAHFYEYLIRRAETLSDAEQSLYWAEIWMHKQPLSDNPHLVAMQLLSRHGRSNEAGHIFAAYQNRRITHLGIKAGKNVQAFHEYLQLTAPYTFAPESVTVSSKIARYRFITILAIRIDVDMEQISDDLLETHLQQCWSLARQVGYACGGVAHRAPDGIIELRFGLENALEDSPRHALRAAFELRRLAKPGHILRIGMHCCRVLVAPDHALTDLPLRLVRAAALANTQNTGLILTGDAREVLAHSSTLKVDTQALLPVHVSGRETPLFWLGTTQQPQLPKSGSSSFMGRDAECRLIHHLAQTVLTERQGRILWIEGQAGIGKTRLLQEMTERLSQSMRVVRYVCLPMYQHSMLHPIAEVIRDALNLSTLPSENARATLQKLLQDIGEEDDLVYTVWCVWLGLEDEHAKMGILRDYKRLLFDSVILVLTSRLFPMDRTLILEDIHWADSATLEWLQTYLAYLHEYTVLMLVSTRRPIPGLQKIAIHETKLVLAPWDSTTSRHYLRNHLHWTVDIPTEESIIRQGCGVPLYLDSLARQTIFRGLSSDLPNDIQSILEFTIAQADFAQDMMQMSAVLGIEVSLRILQALLPDKTFDVLDHSAARLVDQGLWVATSHGWSYRHDLLKKVVYDSIPSDRRKWLHKKVAQWLENHEPYNHDVLAEHFEKGGEPHVAARHHLLAGWQALRFSLYDVALLHYGRASILLHDQPQDPDLLRAQTAYFLILRLQRGHSTEMAQALDDLENICLCQNHQGWHLLAAQYGRWIAENAANGALAGLHQARNLANTRFDPEVDPQLVAGIGHYVQGWNYLWLGHLEQSKVHLQEAAVRWHEAWAEPLFLAIGDLYQEHALAYLSIIDALQNRHAEGWARLAQVRHTLPEAKYGNMQTVLWTVDIAMGYWTDSPEAAWHTAQKVRQQNSYSLIIAKTLTDAFAAWAEARLGRKSIPWAIHHIRRNLNMLRRVWKFGASSIYLALLDLSVRSGQKHTHGVQFAARRLVRQHNINLHKPEIKRLVAMQNKTWSILSRKKFRRHPTRKQSRRTCNMKRRYPITAVRRFDPDIIVP
ncbi:AAA family ATPase [Acidithiobacillus ferrivorans]|uniref:AAA family ATPase n=1 Tax=Acidithiobacillus ferrivorans TaxID=160808 RepID=A0A7T4WFH9_9PROT|nr:AAA family ATPase [Acidithiobacillus ferrivorans]QQD73632.1 AAA family ATPase [Acidithiobacillus ferrivorans]